MSIHEYFISLIRSITCCLTEWVKFLYLYNDETLIIAAKIGEISEEKMVKVSQGKAWKVKVSQNLVTQ